MIESRCRIASGATPRREHQVHDQRSMIRFQIVADSGSTHVPLWPGEHTVDAGANPAIVLGHPEAAPDPENAS